MQSPCRFPDALGLTAPGGYVLPDVENYAEWMKRGRVRRGCQNVQSLLGPVASGGLRTIPALSRLFATADLYIGFPAE